MEALPAPAGAPAPGAPGAPPRTAARARARLSERDQAYAARRRLQNAAALARYRQRQAAERQALARGNRALGAEAAALGREAQELRRELDELRRAAQSGEPPAPADSAASPSELQTEDSGPESGPDAEAEAAAAAAAENALLRVLLREVAAFVDAAAAMDLPDPLVVRRGFVAVSREGAARALDACRWEGLGLLADAQGPGRPGGPRFAPPLRLTSCAPGVAAELRHAVMPDGTLLVRLDAVAEVPCGGGAGAGLDARAARDALAEAYMRQNERRPGARRAEDPSATRRAWSRWTRAEDAGGAAQAGGLMRAVHFEEASGENESLYVACVSSEERALATLRPPGLDVRWSTAEEAEAEAEAAVAGGRRGPLRKRAPNHGVVQCHTLLATGDDEDFSRPSSCFGELGRFAFKTSFYFWDEEVDVQPGASGTSGGGARTKLLHAVMATCVPSNFAAATTWEAEGARRGAGTPGGARRVASPRYLSAVARLAAASLAADGGDSLRGAMQGVCTNEYWEAPPLARADVGFAGEGREGREPLQGGRAVKGASPGDSPSSPWSSMDSAASFESDMWSGE